MVLIIMVIIGLAVDNNLWLYLALGLAVLNKVYVMSYQAAANKAKQDKGKEMIENLFKSIKANNN